jgi:phosphohistidine phosphatase SixA
MEAYIFRHARADFSHTDDPPVSQKGVKEASRVVELASERFGFKPTAIVSSPVLRAKQTAELARKKLGLRAKVIENTCLYGDSDPAEVLEFLSGFKKDDRVVLVSHMPLIFELLYKMTGGRFEVELQNGSVAAVRFRGKAAEGKGTLAWLMQPGV